MRFTYSALVAPIVVATSSLAQAQGTNETVANVNLLNLLSPFLGLNSTAIGQSTLQINLQQAISINNAANLTLQQLAISDKNLLNNASNTVPGLPGTFGVAANLGGGLPAQVITGVPITAQQPVGGLGPLFGPIFQTGVAGGATGPLHNTVALLTTTYNSLTSADLGAAKNYFANGTTNGTTTAVAPAGFTLPTFNGLPNTINSVYDLAYGVTNTQPGQDIFGSSRPVQVAPNSINLFDPTALSGLATNPSFPSGHTTYAYTDSILLAMLVPQQYQNMLSRAAEYANSRIVLGVHYPLDIIASRALASFDISQALTNPAYINNAGTTGTAVNIPSLFNAAMPEIQSYLSSQCGASVATCATSAANTTNNPYVPSAANQATYQQRLTYGLPTLSFTQAPREAAPAGGPDASILLATLYGGSTSAATQIAPNGGLLGNLQTGTINQIIMNTETNALAAFFGTPLSYWTRLDLYSAAGYFQNVTGTLALAATDRVATDVTVGNTGTLGGTGLIAGNATVNSGGTLAPGSANAANVINTPGTLTIQGSLALNAGSTYLLQFAPGSTGSRTTVTGTATIANTAAASVNFAPGIYAVNSRIPVLTTSANGLAGTFSSVGFNSAGINVVPRLTYDGQDAFVTLAQALLPALPAGSTTNAANETAALNRVIGNGGTLPLTFQTLYSLPSATLAGTLNLMAGQTSTAAAESVSTAMSSFLGSVLDFNAPGRSDVGTAMAYAPDAKLPRDPKAAYGADLPRKALIVKAPPQPPPPQWTLWSSVFGGNEHLAGDPAVGSQNLSSRLFGGAAGADYRMSPDTVVGFALSGGETHFSLANGFGTGRSDFFQGSVYGKESFGAAYLGAALAAGMHNVNTDRTVNIAGAIDRLTARFDADTVGGRIESGYRFAYGNVGLTPYVALQVQNVSTPTYTEAAAFGAGAAAQTFAAHDATWTRTEFGAWLDSRSFVNLGSVDLRGRAAWAHNFNRDSTDSVAFAVLPGSDFVVDGARRPSDAALITGMVEAPIARNLSVSGKVDGEFANHATAWSGVGTVRYVW